MKLVFIVGSGRSGTTLLRNILKNHPQIGVAPELRFFDLVMADYKGYTKEQLVKRIKDKIKKTIPPAKDPLWEGINLDSKELKDKLLACTDLKEMFLTLLEFCSTKKAEIMVGKTPSNIFFLDTILDWFEDAKIIHMLRDGRDFIASAKKIDWSESNINLASWWRQSIRAFEKARKKHNEEQFLEIKYRNLINDPEKTLNKVFNFLDLPPAGREFLETLQTLPSYSSFGLAKGLYQSSHFDDFFSEEEQGEITFLLSSYLKKKGYNVKRPKIKPFLFLKLMMETTKLRINLWFRKKGRFRYYQRLKNLFKK